MERIKHDTITEAQHAIMDEIKLLDKDEMSYDNTYAYTSAAFATIMIRPLMIKHGVSKTKIQSENKGRWQNGVGVDVHVTYRFMLVGTTELIEGVNYIDVHVDGSGKAGKSGDKSMYAAATTAGKYADLDFLNLPMVEDAESFAETIEQLEEHYSDTDTPTKDTSKSKTKTKKLKTSTKKEEPEPEQESDVPSNSSEINYSDGVFEIIENIYEEAGINAVLEFTEGDTRNKVEELVEELMQDAGVEEEEEPEPEEEEAEEPAEEPEGDDEGVDLNELDYEDPDVKEALREQIDLDDDQMIDDCLHSFHNGNKLVDFFSALMEIAKEESQEYADSFNDAHFPTLQEIFEELDED